MTHLSQDAISWQVGWSESVITAAVSDLDVSNLRAAIRTVLETAAKDAPAELAFVVSDEAIRQTTASYADPWMRSFLRYDPRPG